jgi:CIC family chloride channel protein
MSRSVGSILLRQRPSRLAESLSEHFDTARYVFMVAAPLGILVGTAIAGYDYVVNELLWSSLSRHLAPLTLCFMPIVALTLTGVILSLFRVKSSSMADEVVRAYHRPDQTIDYKAAIPKLTASVATMGFGGSAGMEGASKWLGATITSWMQNHLNRRKSLRLFHGKAETTLLVGQQLELPLSFELRLQAQSWELNLLINMTWRTRP